MKILVFGSGGAFISYAEKYQEYFKNIEISAFIDNSQEKQGQVFCGKQIIAPWQMSQYCYDLILICSSYQEEIYEQLVSEITVSKEKIYTRIDFFEKIVFPWYDRKYNLYNKRLLIIVTIDGKIETYKKYWDKYYELFDVIGVITINEISAILEYTYDYLFTVDLPYTNQDKKSKEMKGIIEKYLDDKTKLLTNDIIKIYLDNVKEISRNGSYSDKTFLLIRPAEYYEGLGWIALNVAKGVAYAKKRGYIPVVDMKTHRTQYLENEEFGKVNAYTKFFQQPSKYDLEDIKESKTILKYGDIVWMSKKELDTLCMPEMQPELYEKYYEFTKGFNDKKVLGVLFRGTDYTNLKPYGHDVQPDLYTMIETVKQKMLDWGGFDLIYLCTEVKQACEQFIDEFGREKVCYYPQLRYESNTKELLANVSLGKENGHTIQGKEYWIALNCLASCDSIVAGKCAGTMVALAINNHQYQHKYLFELGKYGIDGKK